MSRLRVLLIAEAANPEWTSVPLVGWSHAMALRKVVEAHLVTQVRNRQAILRAGLKEPEDFTAIDSEKLAKPLWKVASLLRGGNEGGWTTQQAIAPLSYYYFEHLVWRQFGERIRAHEFDIVHRLTPVSPAVPSILATKCANVGVPFVIGPLNGGVPWPKWFGKRRFEEREWLAPIRSAYKLMPGHRATLENSAAIIAGSQTMKRQFPQRLAHKIFYVPENAVDVSRFVFNRRRPPALPLQLLFVGRLVPLKGVDMLIEAAEFLISTGRAELTIVGDGPQRPILEQLAGRSSRPAAIRFVGNVPHEKVAEYFAAADLFVFPSVREFGGGVILEAMAMGTVPIVVNYGGPAELVSPDTGFCVDIGPREQIVKCLRQVLDAIAADPASITPKIEAGRERVARQFTWDAKAEQIVHIYRTLTDESMPRGNGTGVQ